MFRFRPSVESLEAREVPSGVSGRVGGIAVDPAEPAADPLPVLLVIADRQYVPDSGVVILSASRPGDAGEARYFNGFVSRFSAGDADATALRRNQVTLLSADLDRA